MLTRRIAILALLPALASAQAQTPPDYGYQFATVGAVNNPAFNDPSYPFFSPTLGRGSVSYQYRIAKTEVSTGQWVEFLNTFSNYATPHRQWDSMFGPTFWGAFEYSTSPAGGTIFKVSSAPNAVSYPVGGISWYMAALYCNWLNNGKSSDPNSLITGAYDTRTWGTGSNGLLTDAPTHLATAKYWIPTLDEQMKAFYYDPHKTTNNGWWKYNTTSDTRAIPGPPGVGQTSAGYHPEDTFSEWQIPLGSYPDTQSPWGLLDTSGGAAEWNEEAWAPTRFLGRLYMGSPAGDFADRDNLYYTGSGSPDIADSEMGFRIASSVPSPSAIVPVVAVVGFTLSRRRRSCSRD
jgi:formylglycine-generating enzyme required for sulfatase activity